MPTTATHDAWIIGEHQFPDDSEARQPLKQGYHHGDVLVHDLKADLWFVLPPEDFNRQYQWA